MNRGNVFVHVETKQDYIVLSPAAMFKFLWWWVGPFVVYRSAANPGQIYIRTQRNFFRRFRLVSRG